jgi:CyaY protein
MESEYRKRIQDVYDRIETALADVDPDIVESEISMGAMTLTFADQTRCILSAQPSVHQLWLALASRGTAYHFNFDENSKSWIDDKGKGIELLSFLEKFLNEMTGIDFTLQRSK